MVIHSFCHASLCIYPKDGIRTATFTGLLGLTPTHTEDRRAKIQSSGKSRSVQPHWILSSESSVSDRKDVGVHLAWLAERLSAAVLEKVLPLADEVLISVYLGGGTTLGGYVAEIPPRLLTTVAALGVSVRFDAYFMDVSS